MSRLLLSLRLAVFATAAALGLEAAAESVKVALLPIVVHSQEKADYLQAGVGDMLNARLAQSPGLQVVRIADVKAATTDVEAARNAARSVGARWVVFGSFTSFGDGASLDLQCARTDASDEGARQIFVQSGALGSIIPKIDDLADRVARYVADPTSPATLPAVGAAPPGRAGPISKADFDDLRRRVELLEDGSRSRATTASGLPPPPSGGAGAGAPPPPVPGSRTNPITR